MLLLLLLLLLLLSLLLLLLLHEHCRPWTHLAHHAHALLTMRWCLHLLWQLSLGTACLESRLLLLVISRHTRTQLIRRRAIHVCDDIDTRPRLLLHHPQS